MKNDTSELADIAHKKDAISIELRNSIKDFYDNYRSKVIHEMLTGEVDVDDLQRRMDESPNLLLSLQELIVGKLEVSEEEIDTKS